MKKIYATTLISVLCLLTSVITGCGKQFEREVDGFTRVVFGSNSTQELDLVSQLRSPENFLGTQTSNDAEVSTAPGADLTLIATNSSSSSSRGVLYLSSTALAGTANWIIPNGSYYFTMIGYNSANMGGSSPICGSATEWPATLGGGTKNITITGASTNCSQTPFSPASTPLGNLSVAFCSTATAIGGAAYNSTCAGLSGGPTITTVGSLKLMLLSGDSFSGSSPLDTSAPGLRSGCMTVTSGLATGLPSFVTGDSASVSQLRMKTHLVTYSDAACATRTNTYILENGLGAPTASGTNILVVENGGTFTDISAKGFWAWNSISLGTGRLFIRD